LKGGSRPVLPSHEPDRIMQAQRWHRARRRRANQIGKSSWAGLRLRLSPCCS